MISADINTAGEYQVDGRWASPRGPILVEVKRTNSMRDVRGALLALVYLVQSEPSTAEAVCLRVDSRLYQNRLEEELNQLRGVLRPHIADRIHLLVDKRAPGHGRLALSVTIEGLASDFYAWLEE